MKIKRQKNIWSKNIKSIRDNKNSKDINMSLSLLSLFLFYFLRQQLNTKNTKDLIINMIDLFGMVIWSPNNFWRNPFYIRARKKFICDLEIWNECSRLPREWIHHPAQLLHC
jgi:hypothetical protein